jgi:gliding motility-associated-like protein
VASALQTTWFVVTGTNNSGCSNVDSVQIIVTNAGAMKMYVPNAFTPNDDGKNDCFGIKNWPAGKSFSISIFNRWGERIFYSADPNACWDGRYNGKMQPQDVFIYMIQAETSCGKAFEKGTFVLIR